MQPQAGQIGILLLRLDGVQPSGRGFRSRCPACGGQARKVSIIEADDGRILLHCFGGCAAAELLTSIGLSMSDLFPVRLRPETPEERRSLRRYWRASQWDAALEILDFEATIVLIAAGRLGVCQRLTAEDGQRLSEAKARIEQAREVLRAR